MVPAATACDCNPPEPRQRAEKSDRAIATLISCAAGAVHSPFGAADSMTSTDAKSVPAGTRARIVCSRFNVSVRKDRLGILLMNVTSFALRGLFLQVVGGNLRAWHRLANAVKSRTRPYGYLEPSAVNRDSVNEPIRLPNRSDFVDLPQLGNLCSPNGGVPAPVAHRPDHLPLPHP